LISGGSCFNARQLFNALNHPLIELSSLRRGVPQKIDVERCIQEPLGVKARGDGLRFAQAAHEQPRRHEQQQGQGYFEATPVVAQLTNVTSMSLGLDGAGCAVTQDGAVSCWGNNGKGYLGFTSTNCGPFYPQFISEPVRPVSIPCEPAPRVVGS